MQLQSSEFSFYRMQNINVYQVKTALILILSTTAARHVKFGQDTEYNNTYTLCKQYCL